MFFSMRVEINKAKSRRYCLKLHSIPRGIVCLSVLTASEMRIPFFHHFSHVWGMIALPIDVELEQMEHDGSDRIEVVGFSARTRSPFGIPKL